MTPALPLTLADLERAAERIAPYVLSTPCLASDWLSQVAGAPVLVKWESLQATGSFKLRGAVHKLLLLRERGVSRVLAVSAGNHGLGVAHAARRLGMRAKVVVPESAARTKVDAIRAAGAELLLLGRDYDEAERRARDLAASERVEFVSPYNDLDVIAGQATVGLELLRQAPDAGRVIVPVGGGGLIAGVALAMHYIASSVEVCGAQPSAAPAMHAALAAGAIVPVEESPTRADGLAGNIEAGAVTVPFVRALVRSIALVAERSIERAMRGFLAHDHMVVEGSGAVPAAALLEGAHREASDRRPIALVVTGRNVGVAALRELLTSAADDEA